MDRSVSRVQRAWDTLANVDPMWAILTDPSKLGLKWSEVDFFESGHREIGDLMAEIDRLVPGAPRDHALDFGCGIGRLSGALAEYYGHVDGVDVAPSMVSLARERNAHPDRCIFHLNPASNLRLFTDQTFDLIYSNIVLQHIQPSLALRYISEFARCAKPGGLVVFQAPHRRRLNAASLRRYVLHGAYAILPVWAVKIYRRTKYKGLDRTVIDRLPKTPMEIHAVHQKRVEKALGRQFRLLMASDPHPPDDAFEGRKYFFRKILTTAE